MTRYQKTDFGFTRTVFCDKFRCQIAVHGEENEFVCETSYEDETKLI